MRKARPIPTRAVDSVDEVNRRVFCKYYDDCLDFAIVKNWRGFSCEECEGYDRMSMDYGQWDEDHSRCMALVYYSTYFQGQSLHA